MKKLTELMENKKKGQAQAKKKKLSHHHIMYLRVVLD